MLALIVLLGSSSAFLLGGSFSSPRHVLRAEAPVASACGYQRRAGDEAAVDIATIEALLDERDSARAIQDFERADAIKQSLAAEHGVSVMDRTAEWWVGPAPRRSRPAGIPRDFGPLGHDYKRTAADQEPLDEDRLGEIHGLIRDRLSLKLSHKFVEADALLQRLANLGVAVNDGRKEWRADGQPFVPRAYVRVPGRGGAEEEAVDVPAVEALLAHRLEAKRERDYETADAIKAELATEHGVGVDDVKRTWSAGTNRAGGYTLQGECPAELDLALVESLLESRARAKLARDYRVADELQERICGMGIELNDRRKMWRLAARR